MKLGQFDEFNFVFPIMRMIGHNENNQLSIFVK